MGAPGLGAATMHGMVPDPTGGWTPDRAEELRASMDGLFKEYQTIMAEVFSELAVAVTQFPPMRSPHEGYAILLEEVDEMWDEVKANNLDKARAEARQVAAMALRFLHDTGQMGSV